MDTWYRYPAGFVEHALKELAVAANVVLDPWNGAGTTTVVAASKKIPAVGIDVNPVLVVVSRARLLDTGVWANIDQLAEDVAAHAASVDAGDDPLQFLVHPGGGQLDLRAAAERPPTSCR